MLPVLVVCCAWIVKNNIWKKNKQKKIYLKKNKQKKIYLKKRKQKHNIGALIGASLSNTYFSMGAIHNVRMEQLMKSKTALLQ